MKSKNKIYLIVAIATLIVFAIGGTYAFFQVLGGNSETRNVNVQTYTTDSLSFSIGDEILIEADQSNFGQNAGNREGTTTGTVRLVPNSSNHTASDTYNVFVVIDSNDFIYTTEAHTPEITLTITDPDGNRHGSITGLNGSNGVFDITTRRGAFLVASDYPISADSAAGTEHEWQMKVTLVNLDSDQELNTGKTLTGTLYITKEDLTTYSLAELNSLVTSRTENGETVSTVTSTSITVYAVATEGTEDIDKYYFGIEEQQNNTGYIPLTSEIIEGIEYFESSEPSYTFTNLKSNTDYKVYSFTEDKEGFRSNIYNTTITTNSYVLPEVTNVTTEVLSLNSIKVTATATGHDYPLSKYYFNCGSGWSEAQDSNEYTCTNLSYNTNYDIKVKVIDTYGKYSTEYTKPSEITAYNVTYSCTNCSSTNSSEYVLSGGSSTSNITANTHYNLTNATVSGCTISNGVATVSNVSADTTCTITAAGNSVTCSAGQYLPASTENCSQCVSGSYCPGGTYTYDGSEHGKNLCTSLNSNYTSSAAGSDEASDCYIPAANLSGKYVATANSNATTCAAGGYCPGTSNVYYGSTGGRTLCSAGKYNSTNGSTSANACTNCTAGYYCNSGSASATQNNCGAGNYCPTGSGSPTACSTLGSGYTNTSTNATSTSDCYLAVAAGKYKTSANGTATSGCGAGKYSLAHNSAYGSTDSACASIDAGCYGTSGTSSCPGECVASSATTAGTYSTGGASSCTTATSGNYVASAKANKQTQCTAGNYCVSGKIQACSGLGTGYTSAAGANANTSCYLAVAAGKYKTSATGTSTANCVAGSYKAAHNSAYGSTDSCTACAGGKTNTAGSLSCTTNCSNNANVSTWNTPTWNSSNNTMSNLCSISACDTTHNLINNACVNFTASYVTYTNNGQTTVDGALNALFNIFK